MFGTILAFIVLVGIASLFILTFASFLTNDLEEEGQPESPSSG
jgi:hypothetical protein